MVLFLFFIFDLQFEFDTVKDIKAGSIDSWLYKIINIGVCFKTQS